MADTRMHVPPLVNTELKRKYANFKFDKNIAAIIVCGFRQLARTNIPGLHEATPKSHHEYVSKACLSEELQTQDCQIQSWNVDSYFGVSSE
jgi:hypothetical protein